MCAKGGIQLHENANRVHLPFRACPRYDKRQVEAHHTMEAPFRRFPPFFSPVHQPLGVYVLNLPVVTGILGAGKLLFQFRFGNSANVEYIQHGLPDVRFHDLRHTYAVFALQSGDDIKTVQENLGHATAAFTLDIYGHVLDEMKQASASRMEKLIQGFAAGQADSGLAVSNA